MFAIGKEAPIGKNRQEAESQTFSFPRVSFKKLKLTPRHEVPIVWMGNARNWVARKKMCVTALLIIQTLHIPEDFLHLFFFLPCYEIRPSRQQSHMRNKTSFLAPGDWRYYKKFTRFLFRRREEIIIFFSQGHQIANMWGIFTKKI